MKHKKKIIFLIITFTASIITILYLFRVSIFRFIGNTFQICPEDPAIYEMEKLSQLIPIEKYKKIFKEYVNPSYNLSIEGNAVRVIYYNGKTSLFSKNKLGYIFIKTVPNMQSGIYNYGRIYIITNTPAPKGYYYQYEITELLAQRKYSNDFGWFQVTDYDGKYKFSDKIKRYP